MSSNRTTKATDLLVRVRYQNKLPPPPFPPRLLHVPTTPQRYATYEFLNPLSSERELPMIIDGELGMPLELGKVAPGAYGDGEYWVGNRSGIIPTGPAPTPHEDDLALLGDATNSTATAQNAPSTPGAVGERKKVDVSWLRRTEYLSSDPGSKLSVQTGLGTPKAEQQDFSSLTNEGRAQVIAASFDLAHGPLSELRHPSKPHLRAESSYEVLPDALLWPNQLDLVRFGEDPGEGKTDTAPRTGIDARLPRAIFRPVEIPEEENRIGYYLPFDEETAKVYEQRRNDGAEGVIPGEIFDFKYVRDYEVATNRQLQREYIFTFHEGEGEEVGEGAEPKPSKRARGAYYAALDSAQTLRKRRPRRNEDPTVFPDSVAEGTVFWDGIAVQLGGMEVLTETERLEREEFANEVEQPPERLQ